MRRNRLLFSIFTVGTLLALGLVAKGYGRLAMLIFLAGSALFGFSTINKK